MGNPTYTQKAPGSYAEIVKTEYDTQNNQTYFVIQRYDVDSFDNSPHMMWMQPRPFPGKPTTQEVLKQLKNDNSVKIIGLE